MHFNRAVENKVMACISLTLSEQHSVESHRLLFPDLYGVEQFANLWLVSLKSPDLWRLWLAVFTFASFFGMQSMLLDTHSWLNIYQIFIQLLSGLIIEQASTKLSFFATANSLLLHWHMFWVGGEKANSANFITSKVMHLSVWKQGTHESPQYWFSMLKVVFKDTDEPL